MKIVKSIAGWLEIVLAVFALIFIFYDRTLQNYLWHMVVTERIFDPYGFGICFALGFLVSIFIAYGRKYTALLPSMVFAFSFIVVVFIIYASKEMTYGQQENALVLSFVIGSMNAIGVAISWALLMLWHFIEGKIGFKTHILFLAPSVLLLLIGTLLHG